MVEHTFDAILMAADTNSGSTRSTAKPTDPTKVDDVQFDCTDDYNHESSF